MSRGNAATRWNLDALESTYQQWRQDPTSVDESWQNFFQGFELGLARPAPAPRVPKAVDAGTTLLPVGADYTKAQIGIVRLIDAYRDLGHFLAHLDPLAEPRGSHPLLELSEFGFTDADLDRTFDTSAFLGLPRATLRELLAALRETYCRTIGVEYTHIQDTHIRGWLQERMELRRNQPKLDRFRKVKILEHLHYAELFERFLERRFKGQKRFSLEGAETLIPLLETIVSKAPELGIREIVLGMAHRGRLNVLANILRKPYEEIFAQFEENFLPESTDGDGDVKYHLGFSTDRQTTAGPVHLSLTANPSHLEAVNPVVEGRTRAKQTLFADSERTRGLPLLIHGDAAFAGQGLVAETLNLSQLQGYTTGGTVHVIVNNQIGFTTATTDARSTMYCTDVAKMIQVPIFHVNGEDPEATTYVAELALEYRQKFKRDVVIDMFCYRRHGHNEGDEPAFTQPLMYGKIRGRPSVTALYNERLVKGGELTPEEDKALAEKFDAKLEAALDDVRHGPAQYPLMHGFDGHWKGMTPRYSHDPVQTGVPAEMLRRIVDAMAQFPDGFTPHPTVARIVKTRREEVYDGKAVDWALAELLSFGSLLLEDTPVRLSGQDSRRGTFSQRHCVLYDAQTGQPFSPLNHLGSDAAAFQCYDSVLSEAAVLGFEFGYGLDAPETLVLWEAQFGDFANGAQVIIDQFICSSESKWQRDSGVVMLLPHGYEGQGPEHSSARLERFLQSCADDNMQVVNASTPAQYFHLLRRQMKRNFRKPLVVMTPKSLLRLKAAVSPLGELISGCFREVLDDAHADPKRVQRVLLCSGKVYYDLVERRKAYEKATNVAILRVEQFYPFPEELLKQTLRRYTNASEVIWVQEESQNMGGWTFMDRRLQDLGYPAVYVGRDASASPATGSLQVHKREQRELVEAAIAGEAPCIVRACTNGRARLAEQAAPGREERAPTAAGT